MAKKPLKLAPKKSGGKKVGEDKLNVEKDLKSKDLKSISDDSIEDKELALEESTFDISEDSGLDIDKTVVSLDLDSQSRIINVSDVEEAIDLDLESPHENEDVNLSVEDDFAMDVVDSDQTDELVEDLPREDFSFEVEETSKSDDIIQEEEALVEDREFLSEAEIESSSESSEAEKDELLFESPSLELSENAEEEAALLENDEAAESDHSEHEMAMDVTQEEVQGVDIRPTTEGKRLCACGHCGVEYYLLKELTHREALCVKCQKVFVIEFYPEEELPIVSETDLEELGARDFETSNEEDMDDDASVEEVGTISIDFGNREAEPVEMEDAEIEDEVDFSLESEDANMDLENEGELNLDDAMDQDDDIKLPSEKGKDK